MMIFERASAKVRSHCSFKIQLPEICQSSENHPLQQPSVLSISGSLEEVPATNGDLVYFFEVRLLSKGNMLARVFELKREIGDFLATKKLPIMRIYSQTNAGLQSLPF
eukprot:GHVO01042087.1.p1 GENE.GHVO01042087.1~~GHVO01042087.1.p1  ORF type:complete len:108 (+),score=1.30 GHVO01042087.1:143-466(+)